ncbi:MAG: outer membrane lipoprotein-sorting protein [Proteobacteria bacterium]|nr:outer membrane lipoprotein-sorting protein [Pseudomonadota bacterium]
MNTMRYAALLLGLVAAAAHADDVGPLLKTADKYRMSSDDMQVETLITVFNTDGSPDKERRYTVYAQQKHRSLVLMQSPAEKGQKVLMLGDDFWLLMPGSQRPLRITPMQKLLGDASTGDIATLSWADDYTGTVAGKESCGEPAQPCLHLSLVANRKGVTYQRIELWVGEARGEPVKADLYVQSDKLAKQARFVMDQAGAPTAVTQMLLRDQLTNKKETQVRYVSRQEHTVPEAWLNPMFLAHNPQLD